MKKQLAIVLGMSLAAGAAVANGNNEGEGEYTQPETSADTGIESETSTDTASPTNFEDLDVNQDTLVSEQEATDSQVLDSEAFAAADANQDGYLSSTEFDASVDAGSNLSVPATEHQKEVIEEEVLGDDAG
ncbi:MAG: hypothetical protein H0W33_01920 [Gammaproteobacteria bacterium]|nr:hypothetical protein [Gammaproteobacteria bacterium]